MVLACRSAVLLPEEPLCVQLLLRERKAKVCHSGEGPYPVPGLQSISGDSATLTNLGNTFPLNAIGRAWRQWFWPRCCQRHQAVCPGGSGSAWGTHMRGRGGSGRQEVGGTKRSQQRAGSADSLGEEGVGHLYLGRES